MDDITYRGSLSVLSKTNDGDDLDPRDLKLVEMAINNHLNDLGKEAFADLVRRVEAGEYRKPWLHGQEHLTRDHEGYVYWKGIQVEHYSGGWCYTTKADYPASRWRQDGGKSGEEAAEGLAAICRQLEAEGIPVTMAAVMKGYDNQRQRGEAS